MNLLKKLFGDFSGLVRVLGPFPALKWATMVLANVNEIAKTRNLQSADRAMGGGAISNSFWPSCSFSGRRSRCLQWHSGDVCSKYLSARRRADH